MVLAILEVSQKQAYIFGSKRLMENVNRSEIIRYVTDVPPDEESFIKEAYPAFDRDKNLVYSGGGHTILQFDSEEEAVAMVKAVTRRAYMDYGLELFAKVEKCDPTRPGESITNLIKALEKKKSLRLSSFHRLGIGLEKEPEDNPEYGKIVVEDPYKMKHPRDIGLILQQKGKEKKENFYAVVHIDGNSMGAKSQEVTDKAGDDWEECRRLHQKFSKGIDDAFQNALKATILEVERWQTSGLLKEPLGFDDTGEFHPIRKVISAGDDICFIVPAKIALRCAEFFLKWLDKNGKIDIERSNGEYIRFKLSACAGIAMVHEKYPFYRAYQMSEALCSSAKKYASALGTEVSAMDWHIEYGQAKDGLSAIREDYLTADSGSGSSKDDPIRTLTLRPVVAAGEIDPEIAAKNNTVPTKFRTYSFFEDLVTCFKEGRVKGENNEVKIIEIPKSKIKRLRPELKKSEDHTELYIRMNSIPDISKLAFTAVTKDDLKAAAEAGGRKALLCAEDEVQGKHYRRSLYFDAIEIMDKFAVIEEGTE